jgi:hypothetical protein
VELPVTVLFAHPTIARLADHLLARFDPEADAVEEAVPDARRQADEDVKRLSEQELLEMFDALPIGA